MPRDDLFQMRFYWEHLTVPVWTSEMTRLPKLSGRRCVVKPVWRAAVRSHFVDDKTRDRAAASTTLAELAVNDRNWWPSQTNLWREEHIAAVFLLCSSVSVELIALIALVDCVAQLAVERWSLTGELSLSCARPTADGWPLMWVNRPL